MCEITEWFKDWTGSTVGWNPVTHTTQIPRLSLVANCLLNFYYTWSALQKIWCSSHRNKQMNRPWLIFCLTDTEQTKFKSQPNCTCCQYSADCISYQLYVLYEKPFFNIGWNWVAQTCVGLDCPCRKNLSMWRLAHTYTASLAKPKPTTCAVTQCVALTLDPRKAQTKQHFYLKKE